MKKLLLALGLLACPLSGLAAGPVYQNVIFVPSAPSGACTNGQPAQIVISTGALYTCQASVWGKWGTGGGTTGAALTMNNGGSGAASGTTFDGSVARTISYNTIGAAPAATAPYTPSGCRLTVPVVVTGTSAVVALACQLPTGSLGANSVLKMNSQALAAAGNTGTCNFGWKVNTSSSFAGTNWAYENTTGAGVDVVMTGSMNMQNSVASEYYYSRVFTPNAVFPTAAPTTGSIDNSANPIYLVFAAQPSSGTTTTCTINEADITVYP